MNKANTLQVLSLCDRVAGRKTVALPAIVSLSKNKSKVTKVMTIGGDAYWGRSIPMYIYDMKTERWSQSPHSIPQEEGQNDISYEYVTALDDESVLYIGTDGQIVLNRQIGRVVCFIFYPHREGAAAFEHLDPYDAIVYGWREDSSLITLHNGRVMRLGGVGAASTVFPDNAIFDPITRKWSALTVAREIPYGAACIVMMDGRVHISGGHTHVSQQNRVECMIYDPSTGGFVDVAPMRVARTKHVGCLLKNGNLFVFGGEYNGGRNNSRASHEIYDIEKNDWDVWDHRAFSEIVNGCVVMDDGNILILPGPSTNSFILNPDTGVRTDNPITVQEGIHADVRKCLAFPLYD